mmetsp:Transcript_75822/g.173569  ORF Transcript_75822/g.173569 Transcript_75822/m.173569 type:complete len:309 (+) Transcript_75822:472-1398(+)
MTLFSCRAASHCWRSRSFSLSACSSRTRSRACSSAFRCFHSLICFFFSSRSSRSRFRCSRWRCRSASSSSALGRSWHWRCWRSWARASRHCWSRRRRRASLSSCCLNHSTWAEISSGVRVGSRPWRRFTNPLEVTLYWALSRSKAKCSSVAQPPVGPPSYSISASRASTASRIESAKAVSDSGSGLAAVAGGGDFLVGALAEAARGAGFFSSQASAHHRSKRASRCSRVSVPDVSSAANSSYTWRCLSLKRDNSRSIPRTSWRTPAGPTHSIFTPRLCTRFRSRLRDVHKSSPHFADSSSSSAASSRR